MLVVPKLSKRDVGYEHPAKHPTTRCELCSHFQPPNACSVVSGSIAPEDWCQRYKRNPNPNRRLTMSRPPHKLAIPTLLATTVLSTPSQALYSTRAAGFEGTYLLTSISDTTYLPTRSSQGVCSIWYNSTYAPSPLAILMQAIAGNVSIFSIGIIRDVRSKTDIRNNLNLFLSDGTTHHWAIFHSVQSLSFDGHWHHISITWDTAIFNRRTQKFLAHATYATLQQPEPLTTLSWDPDIPGSDGTGEGFSTPYLNALFTIGAGISLGRGTIHGFYHGFLSQVFCNFGISRYTDIIEVQGKPSTIRVHSGVGEFNQPLFGGTSAFVPTELGDKCRGPFGPPMTPNDIDAAICMTGGPDSFYQNQGGDTRFLQGPNSTFPLQTSPTDPFGGTNQ